MRKRRWNAFVVGARGDQLPPFCVPARSSARARPAAAARKSRKAIQCASDVTRVNLDGLAVDPAQLTHAIQKRLPQLTGGFCSGLIKSIPTRLIWPDDCCARAATGQNVAMARPAMNWRRRMAPPKDTRAQTMQQPNTFLTAGRTPAQCPFRVIRVGLRLR